MAQHDYSIANQTFPATRSDINDALAAIVSLNSGLTAPSTTVAGMLWYDTTNGLIKQRNAANSDWVTVFTVGKQGLIPQDGSTIYAADAEASDTYVITLAPVPAAYVDGMVINFKANTANTGAATLNVNSLGAKDIRKNYDTALDTNDIEAGQIVTVAYDSDNDWFQLLSPISNVSTVSAASQAEQEAGTETGKYVAPATQQYHPSAVKAWASINGKGTVAILASYNCSSMTDNGTGDYTVNFTTSMSSTTYAAVAGGVNNDSTAASTSNNRAAINTFNKQTGSVDVSCLLISASSIAMGDADYLDLAILGDL